MKFYNKMLSLNLSETGYKKATSGEDFYLRLAANQFFIFIFLVLIIEKTIWKKLILNDIFNAEAPFEILYHRLKSYSCVHPYVLTIWHICIPFVLDFISGCVTLIYLYISKSNRRNSPNIMNNKSPEALLALRILRQNPPGISSL